MLARRTKMTPKDIRRLRQYYHSLRAQLTVFDGQSGNILHHCVDTLEQEINSLLAEYPGLVPILDLKKFYSHHAQYDPSDRYYSVAGLRAYLGTVLGRLQIEIEEPSQPPVTQHKSFVFIKDDSIRAILERDFDEVQRAYVSACWKSVIILCGGTIEAILTDQLLRSQLAKTSSVAPKNPDITKWDLADLIKVAVDVKIVTPGIEKLSSPIREYRNLVHPGNELRNGLTFGQEESRIALEVLNIVHRDLS